MITWLIGENSFEVREALKSIEAASSGTPEKIDGSELTLAQLPDVLMGVSLFTVHRLVIIQDISSNSALFEKLPEWLPRINEDIHLVFVDTKPDKRTSSYKALKAAAEVKEFPAWTERDTATAERWVSERARGLKVSFDRKLVQYLVRRVGVDQWRLAQAVETLSLLDDINEKVIDDLIPASLQENIFQLFETALEGRRKALADQLEALALQEDPYALFALLSSQALSLAATTYASDADDPSKELGIHPFVASKLARYGKRLGKANVSRIIEAFAQTDADMKRSKAEPWLLIERTLLKISAL